MACTKTRTSDRRLGRRDADGAARRRLKALLHEAHRAERVRAELDGDRSDHVEQLIEGLEDHIERVERGETSPDPARFRYWLDNVCSVPAGSPYRWRQASRRPGAILRPLAWTKGRDAATLIKKAGDEPA